MGAAPMVAEVVTFNLHDHIIDLRVSCDDFSDELWNGIVLTIHTTDMTRTEIAATITALRAIAQKVSR